MADFEIFPTGSDAAGLGDPVEWGKDISAEIDSSLDSGLQVIGTKSSQAIDLVRITAGAFVADRLTKRHAMPRNFNLTVHMKNPELMSHVALQLCERILCFLTGDEWHIHPHRDTSKELEGDAHLDGAQRVALLSGGLDSFAHAAITSAGDHEHGTIYVSHQSNPMTIKAQNSCCRYLQVVDEDLRHVGIRLRHRSDKAELTNHSRAMLFAALGIAVADAAGAEEVLVPENGFTSLNVPLASNRQGRYSTRSTHPYTFHLFTKLLDELGLSIRLVNPHEWQTKGEMLRLAHEAGGDALVTAAGQTLSCGKLDGRHYAGGNANIGCGLCYACMVRRASFAAAEVDDPTSYLVNTLTGHSRSDLISRRANDIRAMKHALRVGIDEDELVANTPLPPGYDIDRALSLWQNGLDELALLELPLD